MKNTQSSPFNLFTTTITILLSSFLCFRPAHTHLTPCNLGQLSLLALKFNITKCMRLGAISAEIGWNFMDDVNAKTTSKHIDILFGAKLPNPRSGYMAWGLNPEKPQMVGTTSLIIRLFENGTTRIDPYDITQDTKRGCRLVPTNPINFKHTERDRSYNSTTWFLAMAVSLDIPSPLYKVVDLHHVWQVGPLTQDLDPSMHGKFLQNFDSCLTINHINATTKSFARLQRQVRKAHGAMNIAGWGTILPIGIIIARYFRVYPLPTKYWHRFHVGNQMLGFTMGAIGWVLGISLSNTSKNYSFFTHRILGTTIFAVALLQILALCLKPKRTDMFRQYWHIYHHLLGYALYALIVVNIFTGAHMLSPNHRWKWAYVGILSSLAFIVLVLEIFTWIKFIKEKLGERKKEKPAKDDKGETRESTGPVESRSKNFKDFAGPSRSKEFSRS